MCVNYSPPSPQQLRTHFGVAPPLRGWKEEVWNHYEAPFIIARGGARYALIGEYGLVPKDKQPPGISLSTMNARAESLGEKKSYKRSWAKGRFCIVPMKAFYEPNYETGRAVRWRIRLAGDEPFAVAGLWERWDADTDNERYAFTQITVNADEHPFMRKFHKPGGEKRSLVILRPEHYDEWLNCHNPEIARTFLQPFPFELMAGGPKPLPPRVNA